MVGVVRRIQIFFILCGLIPLAHAARLFRSRRLAQFVVLKIEAFIGELS